MTSLWGTRWGSLDVPIAAGAHEEKLCAGTPLVEPLVTGMLPGTETQHLLRFPFLHPNNLLSPGELWEFLPPDSISWAELETGFKMLSLICKIPHVPLTGSQIRVLALPSCCGALPA